MSSQEKHLDLVTRILHMGLLVCGMLAWVTGEFAEDYEEAESLGFIVHSWSGMALTFFICLRILYGLIGPASVRFINWVPYTKERLALAWEDVLTLSSFNLPDREIHVGLSGLVQTFGLAVFFWMAITGSLLFAYLEPGVETRGGVYLVNELHEAGEGLIPVFIVLHVGAVVMHSFFGHPVWRRML